METIEPEKVDQVERWQVGWGDVILGWETSMWREAGTEGSTAYLQNCKEASCLELIKGGSR